MNSDFKPITPGVILVEEFLKPLGITQAELSKETNLNKSIISDICNGKRRISPKTARRLAEYFGTSQEFWLNSQRNYEVQVNIRPEERKIKIWIDDLFKNTDRLIGMFKFSDLIKKHAEGGADLHYIDKDTPKGYICCRKPDGTVIVEKLKKR